MSVGAAVCVCAVSLAASFIAIYAHGARCPGKIQKLFLKFRSNETRHMYVDRCIECELKLLWVVVCIYSVRLACAGTWFPGEMEGQKRGGC